MQFLLVFQENVMGTFTYKTSYAIEGKENGREKLCYSHILNPKNKNIQNVHQEGCL